MAEMLGMVETGESCFSLCRLFVLKKICSICYADVFLMQEKFIEFQQFCRSFKKRFSKIKFHTFVILVIYQVLRSKFKIIQKLFNIKLNSFQN